MVLISSAYAQSAAAAATQEPSALAGMLPLLLMVVVFYFLLLRPQQKKFKQHQQMVNGLRRGDKVVTSGGIVGTVTKVDSDGDSVQVEIADDVVVKVVRSMIASVVNTTPKAAND